MIALLGGVALLVSGCGKDESGSKSEPAAAKTVDDGADKAKGAVGEAPPAADKVAEAPPEPPPPAGKCGATPCPCKEGTKNKDDDSWLICELSQDLEVQGYSCAAGRIVFHESGKLQECMLTADTEVDGKPCRGKPVAVRLFDNGKLKSCSASKDLEVGGFKVNRYQNISLHDDGTIAEAFLKGETRELEGFQCTGGLRWFKGGKLRMCTLAADADISGNKIKKDTMVVWHEDGSVRGMWNEKKIKWGKKKYDQKERGNWLCFKDGEPDPEGFGCNRF